MRYDTPVFFQKRSQGSYDTNTGNYAPDSVEETLTYACVMDCSADTLKLIYGDIKQGAVKIQLQNHYTKPFDRIRIGNEIYSVDWQRKLRFKHILVAHFERNNDGKN